MSISMAKGLILKMKLVPPSLPRSTYVPSSFWFYIVVLVLVFYWYPSSVRVVATEVTYKYKSWHSDCEDSWILGRMPCSLVFCSEEEL